MVLILIFFFFSLISSISPSYLVNFNGICADGFDPLDPYGNITIKWDLLLSTSGTNNLMVSIYNFQQYRHVEPPGWKLNWAWKGKEVIWSMQGAEATEQGNCTEFKGSTLPHCCEKEPFIVDLLPGTNYNAQTQNCCKGGVLSSMKQDPSKYVATFQMAVGGSGTNSRFIMPENFNLGVPGYSCGGAVKVEPSRYTTDGGRRWTQAIATWNVTCMYSQSLASPTPRCCVSLSAFYNQTIVSCPRCSCGCQGQPGTKCVKYGETPPLLKQNQDPTPVVRCSEHMCPIRVHWHLKQSYKQYWRAKMTVTNFNIMKNYSEWNLVVLHPNLQSLTQVFSFNYAPLNRYGYIMILECSGGFRFTMTFYYKKERMGIYRLKFYYAKIQRFLLSERIFTFREGWGFPRKIQFNGDECVMPPPDEYPSLPNKGHSASATTPFIILFSLFLAFML
uniref:COBRA-like protein n=1 Tax=Populus tomentosa TaxID=118781 RepID=L0AST8_POPTO|nr:COBRA-like protein [Populus tomentosa]